MTLLSLEDFIADAEIAGPLLPSFAAFDPEPAMPEQEEGGISAAYDLGYQTGWAARDLELDRVQTELTQSLQETLHAFSFTLEEARAQISLAIGPVFRDLVALVLPELANKAWAEIVLEELAILTQQVVEAPVTIALSPEALSKIQPLIDRLAPDCRLISDPGLTSLQASFRLATDETLLDFDRLLARIAQLTQAAITPQAKVISNG